MLGRFGGWDGQNFGRLWGVFGTCLGESFQFCLPFGKRLISFREDFGGKTNYRKTQTCNDIMISYQFLSFHDISYSFLCEGGVPGRATEEAII